MPVFLETLQPSLIARSLDIRELFFTKKSRRNMTLRTLVLIGFMIISHNLFKVSHALPIEKEGEVTGFEKFSDAELQIELAKEILLLHKAEADALRLEDFDKEVESLLNGQPNSGVLEESEPLDRTVRGVTGSTLETRMLQAQYGGSRRNKSPKWIKLLYEVDLRRKKRSVNKAKKGEN